MYLSERQSLMEEIRNVEISILDQNENCLCYALLFGTDKLNDPKSVCILNATKKGNIQKALSTQLSGFVVHKLKFVFVSTVVDKFISLI